jgi:hypothetical protein
MTINGADQPKDPFNDHRLFMKRLSPDAPLGSAALMRQLRWKQPGRFKRVRNTLIGLQVVRFEGRGGSARLALGPQDLDTALGQGLDVHVGREIDLYPLLVNPIDDLISQQYTRAKAPIAVTEECDGVTPYITASKRAGIHTGAYTRPDVTVIVDLAYAHLGPWNDVHAVEVKPYWAVGRDGLFEAAAQAALRRCTHSWLIAYIPDPKAPGLDRAQRQLAKSAQTLIGAAATPGSLTQEAASIGIGVAVATHLREDSPLELIHEPTRLAMDPDRADELFASLNRLDG